MIPDRLADKAAAAIYAATVFGDEFAIDAWHDMADDNPVKTTTRMYARAALEAVAADIWEDGYDAGSDDERAHLLGASLIDINQHTPNPYKASEGK